MKRRVQSYAGHGLALLALFCWLGMGAAFAQAQDGSSPSPSQEISVSELLKLPGKLLAEGNNTKPTGSLKLLSYRVEEVALPHPTEVTIRGGKEQVTRAFRVNITGKSFPVRALPAVVWIDEVAVGYGVESEDLDAVTAVTFDQALFRDGATLYLSYGDKKNKAERTELPEKLKLNKKQQ